MHTLLNLVAIKAGGGQQVGLGFLESLAAAGGHGHTWTVVTTAGTAVSEALGRYPDFCKVDIAPDPVSRLRFEGGGGRRLVRDVGADAVLTLFGGGLRAPGVVSVVGSAYSNLYFPEIDFWDGWPPLKRAAYRLRDRVRLRSTLQMDGWIFETEAIEQRAQTLFGLPASRTTTVLPAASAVALSGEADPQVRAALAALPEACYVLFLSGWHRNKSLDLLPAVAHELRRRGHDDVRFLITAPPDDPAGAEILREAERMGVGEALCAFGSVPPAAVRAVVERCDAVALLSRLESFSNNVIEAWTLDRPLVITDAEWSRSTCGEAAEYVDTSSPAEVAAGLIRALERGRASELVAAGHERSRQFADNDTRCRETVAFVESVADLGKR